MVIAEQDIWLKAYCAAITGMRSLPASEAEAVANRARASANQAVEDFAKRFPAFRFASEENKK